MLLGIGVAAAVGSAAILVTLTVRGPRAARFPLYGWAGLAAMGGLEGLLVARTPGVTTFFTALIWTAYILAADGAVYRLRGDSMLHHGGSFAAMAGLSVPAWLLFEAYNLRLANWVYVGVPADFWTFALGAVWAFATIFPGIFETADLVHSAWANRLRCAPRPRSGGSGWVLAGAACLVLPLALPRAWAAYLFALVWAGFLLLLDPLLRHWEWPSLWGDWERGAPGRFWALLVGGGICGFFWEFWNYWAAARWEYIFPILHRFRIFAMPVPGFLGFPPFALECFALYVLLAQALLPPGLRADLLPAHDRLGPEVRKGRACHRART